jgi:hypothetical protein
MTQVVYPSKKAAGSGVGTKGEGQETGYIRGLGSVSNEQTESNTLEIVSAGLHWSFKISRQIWPLLLMLQW